MSSATFYVNDLPAGSYQGVGTPKMLVRFWAVVCNANAINANNA